jgi:hypothetical protein
MLSRLDPNAEVTLTSAAMAEMCPEILTVVERASDDPEHRGLLRLYALATRGSELPGSVMRASGD